ncbi:MAG TPA: metallophosphoesterase [Gemmatimonadales bacterium]|nr:metallophosphoesterase [Gemmatimonadales bacterium]
MAAGLAVACGQHTPTGPSGGSVATVEIVPAGPLTVPPSATLSLRAEARDAAGAVVSGMAATWGTSNPAVAQVSSTGVMATGSVGTATIWSFMAGKGDSVVVSVTGSAPASDAVLVGAGDIAGCYDTGAPYLSSMETALLLDAIPGTVFTVGDNAYPDATAAQYANCYGPSWGRHKSRTRPAPGNHEYNISSNSYFDYFNGLGKDTGIAGKRGQGYYSYDTGGWHIVVLNSEVAKVGVSNELAWLKADLAAHPTACSLAYWHRPFFSSGPHPPYLALTPLIQALYAGGVDVVVSGHNHQYERFAPQDINRHPDPNGIRAFVAGTGGATEYGFKTAIQPNSEVRGNGPGVLKFTLLPTSYQWQFIPIPGVTFRDSGSGQCH